MIMSTWVFADTIGAIAVIVACGIFVSFMLWKESRANQNLNKS
jgi:hypothetical protein